MKRRLIPVVEITTRPPNKGKPRQISRSPTPTEPACSNSNLPSRKKRKGLLADNEQIPTSIPISPTVSDFDTYLSDKIHISPTDTPPTLTRSEETLLPRPQSCRSVSTTIASGSNVTLDTISTTDEDSDNVLVYKPNGDDVSEDDDLVVPGETSVDVTSYSNGQPDIPVRVLRDFIIYDISTNVLVPVAALAALKYSNQKFGASGLVLPYIDEDGDLGIEDEDNKEYDGGEVERVKLAHIIEFDIHSFSEVADTLDSKMYLRTTHAWYILDSPSQEYRRFFVPFWIQHRVLHLMITMFMKAPRITYDEFLDSLQEDDIPDEDVTIPPPSDEILACLVMLGRTLTEADVQSDDVKAYVIASLPDICQVHCLRFKAVPLIQSYLGPEQLDLHDDDYSTTSRRRSRKAKVGLKKANFQNTEREILKHRHATVVTPVVSRIARNLFKGTLEIAGASGIEDNNVVAEMDYIKAHHTDPESMRWGQDPEEGESYSSIIMDGVEYCVGDSVMVNPGDDEDKDRARNAQTDAAQSTNLYANHLWFCRICYFFEKRVGGRNVKMFHGQWYSHGSKTILQQTAHSKSLYLLYKCEDNPTASIFKKCNVSISVPEDQEVSDDAKPDSNDFHCGLVYDEKDASFLDIPPDEEIAELLAFLPSHKPCIACGVKSREEAYSQFTSISDGFSRYGIDYHPYDFVYIRPGRSTSLLAIAQIVDIRNTSEAPVVMVQYLGRNDEISQGSEAVSSSKLRSDERRLYLKEGPESLGNPQLIEGKCFVRQLADTVEIDDWVEYDDHFYIDYWNNGHSNISEIDKLEVCDRCVAEHIDGLEKGGMLLKRNGPIVCLELFSGAGGLGTGLDMSGFVETKYAVEFSPSAALTYQANHPNTTVYCQDSSVLLKHAIEMDAGGKPKPLVANDGETQLPPMPKRNLVDMISGGPPCQSFSLANHNPRADDIRSTLPGNMLSYVEHYNPRYFLLENVAGLLSHRLMSTRRQDKRSLQGGIEGGMIKFIMRSLIALGYQVRFKLLQAGQYGAPQSRRRVIFWGAKRGITIPDYPVPQYAVPKRMNRTTLPTGGFLYPVSRSLDPDDYHQCAPLRAITVNDAIGDLPQFDWINPHQVIPITNHDKRELQRRQERGVEQFEATIDEGETIPGYIRGVEYASEPMNRYQKWLRAKMAGMTLGGHYTKSFTSKIVEATTTVPLKPWADHRDLPLALQPDHAKPGAKQAEKSFYGRMDGASQFKCAMTVVAPNVKQSWLLHPTQKRIMSVRECARAQGFPDNYVFKSIHAKPRQLVDNQIRQIGNAVPIPLALHLGISLGKALVKDWEKNEREGSPIV